MKNTSKSEGKLALKMTKLVLNSLMVSYFNSDHINTVVYVTQLKNCAVN